MQDIHSIRPPVPVGLDPAIFKIILLIIGCIALLLLLLYGLKKWWKKKKQDKGLTLLPPPLSAYASALNRLDLLLQSEHEDKRQFYFGLTAVLRQYVGQSFHFNGIEMTSQEFIRKTNTLTLDKMIKRDIVNFLTASDPIKYAGVSPDKEKIKDDLLKVRQAVWQIENSLTDKNKSESEEKNV